MTLDQPFAGRTALVTGATGGIGLEIAQALAERGARVILPARNREKGESIAAGIPGSTVADLDLASLDSVRAFAVSLDEPIHLCVLNAGIVLLGDRARHLTADGYELHWQTNLLAQAALVRGILPLLHAGNARIAVQCSLAAAVGRLYWDDLQGERRYGPFRAYAQSKLALGLFGLELARREPGLHVALCHPGIAPATAIAAPLRALLPDRLVDAVVRRLGNPPAQAAEPALAALGVDAASGGFYGPRGLLQLSGHPRRLRLYRRLRDAVAARRVWRAIEHEL
ncbi:SDR family NAD(P)-dependent oxidoreductase [Microbacterium horticulturae]|uniref:SDR family NAD(P)-dependent oxidoreductase n=1 Tax=Microbacterium horticulturae TaxID=3028316 RepID=A0ABY8BWQ8_9MICO|nr:SDR family NAD(P)-dependent oxidoreductase [Microbacterium sp. KACC 23027]WEG08603.1 SDR family NAD(P)-dependent oxidoreductase [Microbacterium sp. KACC 23027]